jgi:hypothetical protein
MKSLDVMLSKHAIYQVAERNIARAYGDVAFPEELWEPGVQKIMIHFCGDASLLCGRDLEGLGSAAEGGGGMFRSGGEG